MLIRVVIKKEGIFLEGGGKGKSVKISYLFYAFLQMINCLNEKVQREDRGQSVIGSKISMSL